MFIGIASTSGVPNHIECEPIYTYMTVGKYDDNGMAGYYMCTGGSLFISGGPLLFGHGIFFYKITLFSNVQQHHPLMLIWVL